jgi:hypothetical protein
MRPRVQTPVPPKKKRKKHSGKARQSNPMSIYLSGLERSSYERQEIRIQLTSENIPWKGCVMTVAAERAIISRVV